MGNTFSGRNVLVLPLALLLAGALVFLGCGDARGASVSFVQSISFGNIIADPFGDTIAISAVNTPGTPVVTTFGNTIVSGGQSGLIRVNADNAGQTISFVYPVSATLTGGSGDTMVLDGFAARSTASLTTTSAGNVDFHMGGLLHIGMGQDGGSYNGTVTITINVIN